jgi:hypothetical protein
MEPKGAAEVYSFKPNYIFHNFSIHWSHSIEVVAAMLSKYQMIINKVINLNCDAKD